MTLRQFIYFLAISIILLLGSCSYYILPDFFDTRLNRTAKNNQNNLTGISLCLDCPIMTKIDIEQKGKNHLILNEICDKPKDSAPPQKRLSQTKSYITTARITLENYRSCVEYDYCNSSNLTAYGESLVNGNQKPKNTPVNFLPIQVKSSGANQYVKYLSYKTNLSCRLPTKAEYKQLRSLPHEYVRPCTGYCLSTDWGKTWATSELHTPIGTYPTRSKCGILDLGLKASNLNGTNHLIEIDAETALKIRKEAHIGDQKSKTNIKRASLNRHYNMRAICETK